MNESKVEIRGLFGEHYRAWELTIDAGTSNPFGKLLKRAARFVKDMEPDSVHISGITYDGQHDHNVLYIFASRS